VPSKDIAEGILEGTDGVVSPSALSEVAARYFLDAQPPLLFQEGTTARKSSTGDHYRTSQHLTANASRGIV